MSFFVNKPKNLSVRHTSSQFFLFLHSLLPEFLHFKTISSDCSGGTICSSFIFNNASSCVIPFLIPTRNSPWAKSRFSMKGGHSAGEFPHVFLLPKTLNLKKKSGGHLSVVAFGSERPLSENIYTF